MLRILFATDGSEDAEGAQRFLATLPLPAGTLVQLISVIPTFGDDTYSRWEVLDEVERPEYCWASNAVEQARKGLAREGVEVATTIAGGDPAHQVILAAEQLGADLVVVGSRGLTGVPGFLLGSVARNVAKHAGRPVLVARAPERALRQVVVAVDGSEHASQAVEFAAQQLPLPAEAEITVAEIVRPYYPPVLAGDPLTSQALERAAAVTQVRRREAESVVAGAGQTLRATGWHVSLVVKDGDPATELLKLIEERRADLIVAGARGVSLIRGLFVGSVADRLLKTATCSVLLVHAVEPLPHPAVTQGS